MAHHTLLCSDLLWSDPLVDQYDLNAREHQTVTYLSNRNRGCGYLYGWKAVVDFLVRQPFALLAKR